MEHAGNEVRKPLLIAVRQSDIPLARDILGHSHSALLFSHTLEDAKAQARRGVAAVVCGVHFDKGAVFDLLRALKAEQTGLSIPFFVLMDRSNRYHYSPAIIHGLKTAAIALGATAFVDLTQMMSFAGKEATFSILRNGIAQACSGNG